MVTKRVSMVGVGPTLTALRKMDKDFKTSAKTVSVKIADEETVRIKAAAHTRLQKLAAQSIRSRRGMAPGIAAGGSVPVVSSSGASRGGDVFFGAEFGGGKRPTTQQFPTYMGKTGYFFWPTIRNDQELILGHWNTALDDLAATWDGGH